VRALGDLSGSVAVVTGGNRGIGRAIAVALGRAGASVVVAARDRAALDDVLADLDGSPAIAVECDVTSEEDTARLEREATERFGPADVVVACAGIAGPVKPMHEITLEEWRETTAVDLDGVFLTFRPFIPAMIERRTGSLIAISSMTGKRPMPERTPYSSAKMGVIGLVRTLAAELGPHGVRVNSVLPGAVSGERLDRVVRMTAEAEGISEEAALARFTAAAALRRPGHPEEVAAACVYLASDVGAGVTGEDMNVTAGLVMY
jgi:NAD(P)-dependent dehydrogenase (short-subunit alcohol dehydrogenase family)